MTEAGAIAPQGAVVPAFRPPQPSDEALMARYRDGDAGAFDALYGRHRGGVFRYVLRLCGARAVAEELFQDIWLQLVRARESYVARARFTTYLYRIAHNRVIDHFRATRGAHFDYDENVAADMLAPRGADPAVAAESREAAHRLLQAIEALPPAQREAFLLQQETDMTLEEIAEATGVSRETAKSRLRYALGRLKTAVEAA